jgi:phosphonate transport system substrate-binding protein
MFLYLLIMLAWVCGQLSVDSAQLNFPNLIQTSTQCKTSAIDNESQLIIFAPSQKIANTLTQSLCKDDVVTKQYGEVVAFWRYNTLESFEFVGKGIADLILTKNNIMEAFKAKAIYNYQPVVGFHDYTAFFISAKEKPKITKQYFLDKRIGLLDYPTSRSGHILPKQAFKELDINFENLHVTYASSHEELRELLANGKVDLISSFWQQSDAQRFSKNYITPLKNNIAGTRWYLKMQLNNTDLLCAVQAHLLAMSKQQTLHYYKDAESFWQCNGDVVTLKKDVL